MYYVYLLKNRETSQWYTGFCADLRKRIKEHQDKKVFSTKSGVFDLIYYEACRHKNDALAREKYLKSGMGKRYLKNRLRQFLSLTG